MSSTSLDLSQSIVRILSPGGATVGTGFIVYRDGLIATCAHVVQACGAGPGDTVRLAFHATEEERGATVERDWWRDPGAEDVAILRLQGPLPDGVEPLPLGSSLHSRGHDFFSWGYRLAYVFPGGLAAEGKIQARTLYRNQPALQLLSNQIDRGMSGAPLWDVQGRRVVGMINTFWETTRHQDAWLALAIPTETLRAVCPLLQLSDLCPYRGLEPFNEADAEFFFGRERAVKHLLKRLRQEPRFLAVLGPSGSGKSSLVRAGLIPRLRRGAVPRSDRWAFIVIRPGRNPFGELEAKGLSDASQGLVEAVRNWQRLHPEAERLALVLDQFEELLVDCPDETRQKFVAQLAALLESPLLVTVILVMRDDFYSRFVREARPLVKWLERGLANVPLTLEPDELRAIVEEPARAVGLALEKGLAEVIVREALEATPQGAPCTILPLLEFALTGLWERREEGLLTHAAYQAIGGVTGGLTQWADGVLSWLDEEQRRLARQVLTELVHLGDESRNIPDSRRRRTLDELCRHEGEREAVHQVVRLLADARLLVTGRDLATRQETVELIHDAILHEWGQMRNWLQEDRRFLAWRQTLEERVREWQDKGKDEGLLLRGAALTEAQEWFALRAADIEEEMREFIRLSAARVREEQERRERTRRRIMQISVSAALLFLVVAVLAFWQTVEARHQRNAAIAHKLAIKAEQTFDQKEDPVLTTLLALESLHFGSTPKGKQVLRQGLAILNRSQVLVKAVTFSPDGNYVATGDWDGIVLLWNIEPILKIANMDEYVWGIPNLWITRKEMDSSAKTVVFSPDGRYVASAGYTIVIWDVVSGKEIAHISNDWPVGALAFDPSGRFLVSGSDDGTVRVWEVQTGREVARMTSGHSVEAVAFSPDGRYVVSGGSDTEVGVDPSTVRVWETQTGREVTRMTHESWVTSVAFGRSGKFVVSGSLDNTARVWETESGHEVARMTHEDWVTAVAFSPDGKYVVSGSGDGTARVWEAETGREVARMTHGGPVHAVAFSPDGRYVVSGGCDRLSKDEKWCIRGSARVWEATSGREIARMTHRDSVWAVAFSPDGEKIISGGCMESITKCEWPATIWEALTGRPLWPILYHPSYDQVIMWNSVGNVIINIELDSREETSNGRYKLVKDGNMVRVTDIVNWTDIDVMMHNSKVDGVTFTPDERYVISHSESEEIKMWLWRDKDLVVEACSYLPRNLTKIEWDSYVGIEILYHPSCPHISEEQGVKETSNTLLVREQIKHLLIAESVLIFLAICAIGWGMKNRSRRRKWFKIAAIVGLPALIGLWEVWSAWNGFTFTTNLFFLIMLTGIVFIVMIRFILIDRRRNRWSSAIAWIWLLIIILFSGLNWNWNIWYWLFIAPVIMLRHLEEILDAGGDPYIFPLIFSIFFASVDGWLVLLTSWSLARLTKDIIEIRRKF